MVFFIFTSISHADEGWVINTFQSDITIQQDGRVQVTETIDVNFGSLQKHGIYRDISYVYYFDNGKNVYADITVSSVTQNNLTAQYDSYKQGNYVRLKIGDQNSTISGKNKYQIIYTATGVLRSFEDHDELYWDVTGNGWPVPITKTFAQVALPKSGITGSLCFEGPQGSTEKCRATITSQQMATFSSLRPLQQNEGMSIVLGYQKGMVPILQVTPPASYTPSSNIDISSPNVGALLITLLCGLGISYFLWSKHGRDLWLKKPGSQNSETIVVEYKAPDNMRPAEVGTIFDERADTLDVSATIIDLATRGFLTITEQEKKWLFGSTDYVLTKTNKDTKSLLDYEETLLDRIFSGQDSVKVSELKQEFYDDLAEVKEKLYKDVIDKKYFPSNPETVRARYAGVGVAILLTGVALIIFGLFEKSGYAQGVGWGLLVNGVVFIILSRSMPRKTATGYSAYRKILGFEMFIEKAEKYRQQFFERENIFNEVLPYAIVFGVSEKFAKALKDLGIKPPQPTWYVSSRPFNPILFSSTMNSFSNSLTSAIASQPRKNSFVSAGSGFSRGGGFSGGGFGGGGGGSW